MQKTILELFSGSRTISKTFESHGYNSISIDNNPILNPSICKSFLDISIEDLPGEVSFIWASPPCTHFSRLANAKHWHKTTNKYRIYSYVPVTPESQLSCLILQKTIDILKLYPLVPFVIENPVGRIRHMQPMKNLGHYRYGINYADFGFSYTKETYLFSNLFLPFSTKKVFSDITKFSTINNRLQRSAVPAQLIETIIKYLPDSCTS